MIVDTTHPLYVAALEDLESVYSQFVSRYRAPMEKMNKAELRWLYNHDPLVNKFFTIASQLGAFKERAGFGE